MILELKSTLQLTIQSSNLFRELTFLCKCKMIFCLWLGMGPNHHHNQLSSLHTSQCYHLQFDWHIILQNPWIICQHLTGYSCTNKRNDKFWVKIQSSTTIPPHMAKQQDLGSWLQVDSNHNRLSEVLSCVETIVMLIIKQGIREYKLWLSINITS